MHGTGRRERKRKAGIELDFDKLLARDDEPPPELLIQDAREKSMPLEEADEVEPGSDIHFRNLSEKELKERIARNMNLLNAIKLSDGGVKLRDHMKRMEAELARRSIEKDNLKCNKLITLVDESTGNGEVASLCTK